MSQPLLHSIVWFRSQMYMWIQIYIWVIIWQWASVTLDNVTLERYNGTYMTEVNVPTTALQYSLVSFSNVSVNSNIYKFEQLYDNEPVWNKKLPS